MLPGLTYKEKEKTKEKKMNKEILTIGNFAGHICHVHGDYLASAYMIPAHLINSSQQKIIGAVLSSLQDKYNTLVTHGTWTDNIFRTVFWNICLQREARPFDIEVWNRYKELYYAGGLDFYVLNEDNNG